MTAAHVVGSNFKGADLKRGRPDQRHPEARRRHRCRFHGRRHHRHPVGKGRLVAGQGSASQVARIIAGTSGMATGRDRWRRCGCLDPPRIAPQTPYRLAVQEPHNPEPQP